MTQQERALARDLLELQEGDGPVPTLDDAAAHAVLRDARRIAIVGASPDPDRPSHGVMSYLLQQGYECVPINPTTDEVLGRRAYPTLEAAASETGPFDLVDVFRKPQFTPEVAHSAVAINGRVLWLQLGIVNWEAARIARDGGLQVVMDRCTAIEVRRMRMLDARG